MKYFIWMICLGLIGFSACKTAQTGKNQSSSLTPKYWRLVELNGVPVAKDPLATREAHMILKGTQVNGNTGCNSFFGSFELKADSGISFGKMGSTLMACKDMQLDKAYLDALTNASSYSVNGNVLILYKEQNIPLAFFSGRDLR